MLESSQIDKMSVVERLQAIEQLWDAVCREAKDMASPETDVAGWVAGCQDGIGRPGEQQCDDSYGAPRHECGS